MKENVFTHDHFNTWQICKNRYYFKYVKKLNWPDFEGDYELGQSVHALIDYYLRGINIEILLKDAANEVRDCWDLIKQYDLLQKKLIKTEWGFNSRVGSSKNWLIGRIDAIFYEPETQKYIIADWKTGKYIPKKIETNYQHKIYLYAFYKSQNDLETCFKPNELEFRYIKIQDEVSANTIKFSQDKNEEYEQNFLKIIENINDTAVYNIPDACPLKNCAYSNLCFR